MRIQVDCIRGFEQTEESSAMGSNDGTLKLSLHSYRLLILSELSRFKYDIWNIMESFGSTEDEDNDVARYQKIIDKVREMKPLVDELDYVNQHLWLEDPEVEEEE